MQMDVYKEGNRVTIMVRGEFNFHVRSAFRDAYKNEPPGTEYVIGLGGVATLDSAAIGMLLLLREHAGGDHSKITLSNCQPYIKKLLHTSQLDQLFKVT
ncbi:MAG: STAS domain-containing protein [Magnetococcales bacterium]|nr:STAS domain-containing protein [Magnetococcales bacterium]